MCAYCLEDLTYVVARLGAALNRLQEAIRICYLLNLSEVGGFLLLILASPYQVFLVPDKDDRHSIVQLLRKVVLYLPYPEVHVSEALLRRYVVDYHHSMCVLVEPVCDRLEPFLA